MKFFSIIVVAAMLSHASTALAQPSEKEKKALRVEAFCEKQQQPAAAKMEDYCRSHPRSKQDFCFKNAWRLLRESREKCYRQNGVEPPNDGLD